MFGIPAGSIAGSGVVQWPELAPTPGKTPIVSSVAADGTIFFEWVGQAAGAVSAINDAAENRLTTIGATTSELDAEGNLTFDGSKLVVSGSVASSGPMAVKRATGVPSDEDFYVAGDKAVIQDYANSEVAWIAKRSGFSAEYGVKEAGSGFISVGGLEIMEFSDNGAFRQININQEDWGDHQTRISLHGGYGKIDLPQGSSSNMIIDGYNGLELTSATGDVAISRDTTFSGDVMPGTGNSHDLGITGSAEWRGLNMAVNSNGIRFGSLATGIYSNVGDRLNVRANGFINTTFGSNFTIFQSAGVEKMRLQVGDFYPPDLGTNFGKATNRWNELHANEGHFSGGLDVDGAIKLPNGSVPSYIAGVPQVVGSQGGIFVVSDNSGVGPLLQLNGLVGERFKVQGNGQVAINSNTTALITETSSGNNQHTYKVGGAAKFGWYVQDDDLKLYNYVHSPAADALIVDGDSGDIRFSNSVTIGGTHTATSVLDLDDDVLRVRQSRTPASSSAAGNPGEWAWDSEYFYGCIATNQWGRLAWEKSPAW